MASFIPKNIIHKIRATSDIVDFISETVILKKTGNNFVGLCPFHSEKTPSFTVSPDKQIYYCFGCGKGGNIFSFLMNYEGLTFPESVKTIAGRNGIEIPKIESVKKKISEYELLTSINHDTMAFFEQNMIESKLGNKALTYLKKRGIKSEIIKRFKIGFASPEWNSLKIFLGKKGYSKKSIVSSGLVIEKKGSNITYDRFRNRLIFPIHNNRNSVIGFGARTIDDNTLPKYINSPETLLYIKRESLYGINVSKDECRKTGTVFIVEGYFDVISLYQFGIKNVVATLGTSITLEHIRQIKGLVGTSGKAILVYDSDQAGLKAAYKSLYMFKKEYFSVNVMVLPKGYDPDSFIMEFGSEKFIAKSQKAQSILSFIIRSEIFLNGSDIKGKVKTISKVKNFISSNENPLLRSIDIQELADQIGIEESIVVQEINKDKTTKKFRSIKNKSDLNSSEKHNYRETFNKNYRLERHILAMILQFPRMIEIVENQKIINQFKDELFRKIATLAINKYSKNQDYLNNILEACDTQEERSITTELALTEEEWEVKGCMLLIKQFKKSTRKINNSLMKRIAYAEEAGDVKLVEKLLKIKQYTMTKTENNS